MIRVSITIIFLFFFALSSLAQNKEDSLRSAINLSKSDSGRFSATRKLLIYYFHQQKISNAKGVLDTFMTLCKKRGDNLSLGIGYGFIGDYYSVLGKNDITIQNYLISKNYIEKTSSPGDKVDIYNSLGVFYFNVSNIKSAKYYFKLSSMILEKMQPTDDERLVNSYNNIGACEASMENFSLAKYYFRKALKVWLNKGDSANIASGYNNLANIALHEEKTDSATFYFEKALRLKVKFLKGIEVAKAYVYTAESYMAANRSAIAKQYYLKAEPYLDTSNTKVSMELYGALASAFAREGDYKLAYSYLEKQSLIAFKRLSEMDESSVGKAEKAYLDSLVNNAQKEVDKLKIENQKNQIEKDKYKEIILVLILVFVIGSGIFIYSRYKVTQKQKNTIEEQKQLVEKQNEEISLQKHLVEEKQTEIIDSIKYARLIQQAVLTNTSTWHAISPQHFIVFKPKDIVSGDFFWAHKINEKFIWCVADCTGHGVPGAFMSMLGNSLLNEIVVENKITGASEILNRLRNKIIAALSKETAQQNDGMDVALCVWDKNNKTLEFAGANNGAILIRDNHIVELKGDKMPVGNYHGELKPFSSISMEVYNGDVIYMYSDGLADQFGGPNGKKFRYKQLNQILLTCHKDDFVKQHDHIENAFLDWKGDLQQTDDVCVVGIKLIG